MISTKLASNIVEILQQRAIERPEDLAYIFLQDGEHKEIRLTYRELEQRVKAIAFKLQQITNPGSRALLVYPYNAGLEFIVAFFGCMYAGVIAVPCHPPQNRLTALEIETRFVSAKTSLVLTESGLLGKLQTQLSQARTNLQCLATDRLNYQQDFDYTPPKINPDDLAFLQYTSGSTGEPKGVMITHRCLLQNQEMLRLAFGHTKQSVGVSWLPLFHDMGLIGHVIQPVYLGICCVMMSPIAFIQKPIRWLQAISKYQATTSGAPNFAYDLLCDRVKPQQLEQLDLSSWEVAFSGAEPVRAETLAKFSDKFAKCGFKRESFYPCYGMAEATLMITGGDKHRFPNILYLDKAALEQGKVKIESHLQQSSSAFISAGYPWLDGKVAIVDPESLVECQADEVGEIWFTGSSVGEGYWQLPEKTKQTFQADLSSTHYLRTGDLGFLHAGELYITGRMKDVLVFWGLNHYPQHIEQTVEQCHPGLKANCGAAFSVEVLGKPRLVIVQEIERSHRKSLVLDEVVEKIRWSIFEQHFIDVYGIVLLQPGRIPKTSSGKVQRSDCKAQYLANTLTVWGNWHSPDVAQSDVTALIQRYTNPITYLKIFMAIAKGKWRRWLYLLFKNSK
ncbi:MAG: fatty acyl-AMP ligase [Cyanobacteria bacterium P01_G01_bin.19]